MHNIYTYIYDTHTHTHIYVDVYVCGLDPFLAISSQCIFVKRGLKEGYKLYYIQYTSYIIRKLTVSDEYA